MKKMYIAPELEVIASEEDMCEMLPVSEGKEGGKVEAPEDNAWDIWGSDED